MLLQDGAIGICPTKVRPGARRDTLGRCQGEFGNGYKGFRWRTENGKVGSSFDDFLAEQGILEQCEEQAIKQILADQIKAAMEQNRLTKAAMAARMQTSRRALDRLLDPSNTSVTLHTLQRAAVAIGRQLRLELI